MTSSDLYKCGHYWGQIFSLPQVPKLMSMRDHQKETQMNGTIRNLEIQASDIYMLNRCC